MKARIIELAEALRNEIQQTREAEFCEAQNDELADMEWKIQKFIEMVDGKCAVPALEKVASVLAAIQITIQEGDDLVAQYNAAKAAARVA